MVDVYIGRRVKVISKTVMHVAWALGASTLLNFLLLYIQEIYRSRILTPTKHISSFLQIRSQVLVEKISQIRTCVELCIHLYQKSIKNLHRPQRHQHHQNHQHHRTVSLRWRGFRWYHRQTTIMSITISHDLSFLFQQILLQVQGIGPPAFAAVAPIAQLVSFDTFKPYIIFPH